MTKDKTQKDPLIAHLEAMLSSLDNRIAREMQLSPAEKEAQGVLKWKPLEEKTEMLVSQILNSLGEKEFQIESMLILLQATSKALKCVVEDLGSDGLGEVRTSYISKILDFVERDTHMSKQLLTNNKQYQLN